LIRAVLDEVVPSDAAAVISNHEVSVDQLPANWRSSPDGDLLDLLSRHAYDWLITCDKRMPYQQNLARRSVSVLVLPTQLLAEIGLLRDKIREALAAPVKGKFVVLDKSGEPQGTPVPHLQGS